MYLEAIGWTGTIIILAAYFLISRHLIDVGGKLYPLLNLAGAACLGINVFYKGAWAVFILQIVWGIIAITSLLKSRQPDP